MGVRVSIVASADLSVLQLKTQGRNVVPYIKIMINQLSPDIALPCVPHLDSQKKPTMTVMSGANNWKKNASFIWKEHFQM